MDKKIKFHGYSIVNFTMTNEENIKKEEQNNMEIKADFFKNEESKHLYKTILKIDTKSDVSKIYLELEGIFEFPPKTDETEINTFLKYSSTAILYPYCRSFISMVTGFDSGETIILPVINFYDQNI